MHENVSREEKESIKKSQKGGNPNPRNSAGLAELPRMAAASDTHVGLQRFGLPPLIRDAAVRAVAWGPQRMR